MLQPDGNPIDTLQRLGVTIIPLTPFGNHQSDPRAQQFTIPWGLNGPASDMLTCLHAMPTPVDFTYSVSIQEPDGVQRVVNHAGIAEHHGTVAVTMGRAIDLAIENIRRSLSEVEGYRAAEAWTDDHPGDELTMEVSSRLTESIQIRLPIEQIIVNMFPLEWNFET